MPFTVAHAAAALPLSRLSRTRLPMAALMIGAMSPDFGYFPPLEVARMSTHNLPGVLQFCLPAGLVVWLVYVLLVERPTIALLPDAWRTRLAPSTMSLPLIAFACLAIMLGALTHIAWDAFTHASTPVVDALPPLADVRVDLGHRTMPLYRFLQYLSSVFGMAALGVWALRLRRLPALPAAQVVPGTSMRARIAACIALVVVPCAFAVAYVVTHQDLGREGAFFYFLIGGMTGFAVAWCGVSVWVRAWYRDGLAAPAR